MHCLLLLSTGIQWNHTVHLSVDRSINRCTCAYCPPSLSIKRALLHLPLTWKHTTHLKSPGNSHPTRRFPHKHGAETGRSRLILRAQPSTSPSSRHGCVRHQQHAAFSGTNAPRLIKWMLKREHLQTSAMREREASALCSWLLWIQRLMCAAPYPIAPSLSSQILPLLPPPSITPNTFTAIKNSSIHHCRGWGHCFDHPNEECGGLQQV